MPAIKRLKAKVSVTAESEADLKKQIDALDGVEGDDATQKRKALYDKLEKMKGTNKDTASKKQIIDTQGKIKRMVKEKKAAQANTRALPTIDVKAAVQSMANMEVADSEPSMLADKLIEILRQRFGVVGVVKVFEASSFSGKGLTLLTRQSGGDIFTMKMVLGGNGFRLTSKSLKALTFSRVATDASGQLVNVDVTLLAGVPDLASICIYS